MTLRVEARGKGFVQSAAKTRCADVARVRRDTPCTARRRSRPSWWPCGGAAALWAYRKTLQQRPVRARCAPDRSPRNRRRLQPYSFGGSLRRLRQTGHGAAANVRRRSAETTDESRGLFGPEESALRRRGSGSCSRAIDSFSCNALGQSAYRPVADGFEPRVRTHSSARCRSRKPSSPSRRSRGNVRKRGHRLSALRPKAASLLGHGIALGTARRVANEPERSLRSKQSATWRNATTRRMSSALRKERDA
jgi:hypothetical protein